MCMLIRDYVQPRIIAYDSEAVKELNLLDDKEISVFVVTYSY